jgi:transcription elongation factor GreA
VKYISSQKLKELKKELQELKSKRSEISKRIREAQDRGDISESAEYVAAKEAQAFNEGRIQELEQIVNNAVIISKKKKCDLVDVGCQLVVRSKNGRQEFVIVGSEEADPVQGKISNESPLGRAFLGKKEGDEIRVQTPKGKALYKIMQIK